MKDNLNNDILIRFGEIASLLLWESNAIRVNSDEPFKLASGNFSPVYINCRRIISSPGFMSLFNAFAQNLLERKGVKFDMVAGGETAGIPFAAYLASHIAKPMLYVRKARKGYGLASLVEGGNPTDQNVLLVEDLITDAGSKLHFLDAIQEAGGTITDVLVLFDREQGGTDALKKQHIRLHSVTNLTITLKIGDETGFISHSDFKTVQKYLDDPEKWHLKRGLEFKV